MCAKSAIHNVTTLNRGSFTSDYCIRILSVIHAYFLAVLVFLFGPVLVAVLLLAYTVFVFAFLIVQQRHYLSVKNQNFDGADLIYRF